jgi:hypothetical protein
MMVGVISPPLFPKRKNRKMTHLEFRG